MCRSAAKRRAERRQLVLDGLSNTLSRTTLGRSTSPQRPNTVVRNIPIADAPPPTPPRPAAQTLDREEPDHPPPSYQASTSGSQYNFDPADISRMSAQRKAKEAEANLEASSKARDHSFQQYPQSPAISTPPASRPLSAASSWEHIHNDVKTSESAYRTPLQYPVPHQSQASSSHDGHRNHTPYSPSDVGRSRAPSVYAPVGGAPIHSDDAAFGEYEQTRLHSAASSQSSGEHYGQPQHQQLAAVGKEIAGQALGFLAALREHREQKHAARQLRRHRRRCWDNDCRCRAAEAVY